MDRRRSYVRANRRLLVRHSWILERLVKGHKRRAADEWIWYVMVKDMFISVVDTNQDQISLVLLFHFFHRLESSAPLLQSGVTLWLQIHGTFITRLVTPSCLKNSMQAQKHG